MERFKKILYGLLHPGIIITILIIMNGTGMLIYTFAAEKSHTIFGYVSYALSCYALVLIVVNVPKLLGRSKKRLEQNRYTNHYIHNRDYRAKVSLYIGLGINLLYAIFNGIISVVNWSAWAGAIAGYYFILSIIRFVLAKSTRNNKKNDYIAGLRLYRLTGILMFLLNIAMSGVIAEMLRMNHSFNHSGLIIYVSAVYTFYIMTLTIINLFRYHNMVNPVLSAAKMLSFAAALMSLMTLQTALIAEFGTGEEAFYQNMNSVTGVTVSILVFAMAIYMVIRANKLIKKSKEECQNE